MPMMMSRRKRWFLFWPLPRPASPQERIICLLLSPSCPHKYFYYFFLLFIFLHFSPALKNILLFLTFYHFPAFGHASVQALTSKWQLLPTNPWATLFSFYYCNIFMIFKYDATHRDIIAIFFKFVIKCRIEWFYNKNSVFMFFNDKSAIKGVFSLGLPLKNKNMENRG